MKIKLSLIAFLLLMGGWPAQAQVEVNGKVTAQYSSGIGNQSSPCSPAGSCVALSLQADTGSVAVAISGTFSGTMSFYVSADCTTFTALTMFPPNSTTGVTSTTGSGNWSATVGSYCMMVVRGTSYSSGAANIHIRQSNAVAANSFGGGVGGGGLSGMTASQVPIAATATTVTSSVPVQGTDGSLLSSGTISGTSVALCTDANGGATTSSCPSAGTGTVTHTPGALTSTAVMTGNGGADSQTPCATCTLSSGGALGGLTSVATVTDGVHPSQAALGGNTTLPSLAANTVTILGPPSATPTAWSFQFPTAIPTTTDLFSCVVTSTNCLLTDSGVASGSLVTASSTNTFTNKTYLTSSTGNAFTWALPGTVAGANSGGVGCATSTTAFTTSVALTLNVLPKGGGAGACPTNGLTTDNGTTSVYTGTGGTQSPAFTATGTTAGFFDLPQGTTSAAVAPCNVATSICEQAPAAVTSYLINRPGAAPNIASYRQTDGCGSAICTETYHPVPVVLNVASDFTDSTSTSLQLITGLSTTMPVSKAVIVNLHCGILFDQASAAVSDQLGIGITGTAPTQANAGANVFISASTVTVGTLTALASTTPTSVVTFTPSAITTIWRAELDATIEQPSNATPGVLGVYVATTTGADNIIVKRGSGCTVTYQ